LFFVLEVPVGKDGMVVAHEERDVELLSFVGGSGVAVYARSDVMGLFDIVCHEPYFCTVGMMGTGGVGLTVAGVYIPPRLSGVMLTDIVRGIGDVDIMFGDFNAGHPEWSEGVDVTHYPSGDALLTFAIEAGFRWIVARANTYRDVSVLELVCFLFWRFLLVWLRSGASSRVGHEFCDRLQDRFHISPCQLSQDGRRASDSLFNDKVVHEWRDWWEHHEHLGMHVVRHKSSIDGVMVVGGNPFDDGIRISVGGGSTIPARFIKPAVQCDSCGKTSIGCS